MLLPSTCYGKNTLRINNGTLKYYSTLSSGSKARCTENITEAGLKTDAYVIPNEAWAEEPVSVPQVSWSDMFLYMVSTSLYTKQEMMVCSYNHF